MKFCKTCGQEPLTCGAVMIGASACQVPACTRPNSHQGLHSAKDPEGKRHVWGTILNKSLVGGTQ